MIIIPMMGKSERFFNAGYVIPKYQLPLRHQCVFYESLLTFKRYFRSIPFVFIVRSDFGAREFVAKQLLALGVLDFRIIELNEDTGGQAETVIIGTRDYSDAEDLLIFNIDTIRHNFMIPDESEFGDGFLEVFRGDGDRWSFIEPGINNQVNLAVEKNRISDLCSNGMYGFKRLGDFRAAYNDSESCGIRVNNEIYIAPLYNYLIKAGKNIKYRIVTNDLIENIGTPEDYSGLLE